MKVYHQLGFRYNWNNDSFKSNIGDGLIFSPVNIEADKLKELDSQLKKNSFLDPQLYLLNVAKGELDTYPFFPGKLASNFMTVDLHETNSKLAQICVDFQFENNFEYIIIPTRYYEDYPTNYFMQSTEFFVTPFCNYVKKKNIDRKVLLSVIVKNIMLIDEEKRNEVLNWITSHQNISGVYLIFEDNFTSKQIKDFDFLYNALKLISILKYNELEVHIGYSNTEGLLYSIAMPDSVSMGSYENLRSFSIKRFQDLGKSTMRSPNARLYSSKLLQWIDYQYIGAMKKLIPDYETFFDDSDYKPLMFKPDFKWHFAKPEPYKHYFYVFNKQVKSLPNGQRDRIDYIQEKLKEATTLFKRIEERVLLDEDSDGSHLPTWYNVINAFKKDIE